MLDQAPAGGAPIDRYVVQEYLAEGGMGAIYLGKKLGAGGFQKQVVLKQLLPEFTQQPEFDWLDGELQQDIIDVINQIDATRYVVIPPPLPADEALLVLVTVLS